MTDSVTAGGCCNHFNPQSVTTCWKTQGPFGELINPFQTHVAIGATGQSLFLPVDPTNQVLWLFDTI